MASLWSKEHSCAPHIFPLMRCGRKWACPHSFLSFCPSSLSAALPNLFPSCSIHAYLWHGKLKKYHYVLAYSELTSKATWMYPGTGTGCLTPWCMALLKASARTWNTEDLCCLHGPNVL